MRRSAKYHLEPIFSLPARGLATTASHSRRSLSESWQPLLSPALIICLSFPALLSPLLPITPSFIASSPLLPVRIARFPRHHGSFGGLPRPSSSPSPLPPSGKWVYLATVGRLSAGACPGVCVYACACTCVTHLCICTSGGNICCFMRACPCFSLLFFFIFLRVFVLACTYACPPRSCECVHAASVYASDRRGKGVGRALACVQDIRTRKEEGGAPRAKRCCRLGCFSLRGSSPGLLRPALRTLGGGQERLRLGTRGRVREGEGG